MYKKNWVPDKVSFDLLFESIVPQRMHDGSVDYKGRCSCAYCKMECHSILRELATKIPAIHSMVAEQNCPQAASKNLEKMEQLKSGKLVFHAVVSPTFVGYTTLSKEEAEAPKSTSYSDLGSSIIDMTKDSEEGTDEK